MGAAFDITVALVVSKGRHNLCEAPDFGTPTNDLVTEVVPWAVDRAFV